MTYIIIILLSIYACVVAMLLFVFFQLEERTTAKETLCDLLQIFAWPITLLLAIFSKN
jgi:hypothetical protein